MTVCCREGGFPATLMGCGPSKLDNLPLVNLCKQRKQLIKSSADHRFSLAAAHIAYFRQLRDFGDSLCRFVEEELVLSATSSSAASSPSSLSSPVLTLPSDDAKKFPSSKNKSKNNWKGKAAKGKKGNNTKTGSSSTSISHNLKKGSSSISDESDLDHHSHYHDDGHLDIDEDEDEDDEDQMLKNNEKVKVNKVPSPQPGISYVPPPNDPSNYPYSIDPYYNPQPQNYYDNPYYPPPMNFYNNNNGGGAGTGGLPPYSYYPSNYNVGNNENAYGSNTSYKTYYMKKSSTRVPSVIYEEPKQSPIFSFSDYSKYPGNGNGNVSNNQSNRDPGNGNGNVSNYQSNRGGGGGYFGLGTRQPNPQQQPQQQRPPTPPSPKVSTWDYFNPFETFESVVYPGYYPQVGYRSNTSSPDSTEVREREGIPDLEEETESEVSKEPYIERMKMKEGSTFPRNKNKSVHFEDSKGNHNHNNNNMKKKMKKNDDFGEGTSKGIPPMHNQQRGDLKPYRKPEPEFVPDPEPEPDPVEVKDVKSSSPESISTISTSPEEMFVKKKGVSFGLNDGSHLDIESSKPSSLTTISNHGTRDLREVVREIKDEFEAATDYGKEVSVLLEVGKEPYKSHNTFLKVMLARVCSSSPSAYHTPSSMGGGYPGDPENGLNSQSLTSTLDKLYVWEKKLYKEVKEEERLRVMYEKQLKRLKSLDDRGADSSKLEATEITIKKLLTRINVSVKAVDSISNRIHKLRDEELQPRLTELIYGLRRMWKLMLKCHHKQFHAILESRTRALKANTGLRKDSSVRATIQLEAELIKWSHRFNNWVEMQRSYAETLNGWLKKCLNYEPEITPDGEVPYSPGRIGAPPVFIICHDWKQALERVSSSEVQTAMNDFATSLHQLWECQDEEQRRRLKSENLYKGFEKQIREIRMERQRRGGHEQRDDGGLSDKNSLSMVASESGISVSALDDLKVDLDSMRQKVKEERAGHKEAVKLVHDAVSRSIQAGLIPIFEALESFTSEASKAFDDVRLEHANNNGGSGSQSTTTTSR